MTSRRRNTTRTIADYLEDSKKVLCQKLAEALGVNNIDIYRNYTKLLAIAPYILQDDPGYRNKAREILGMPPMTDERKKQLQSKSKKRWEMATKLAAILGYRKDFVFNKMSQFDINGILMGNRKAKSDATQILLRTAFPATPAKYEPSNYTDRPKSEEDQCDKAMDEVKIMLWAIKKIGCPDEARKAFNRAYNLKKDLLNGD